MSQARFPFEADDPENAGQYRHESPPPPRDGRGRKPAARWRIARSAAYGRTEYLTTRKPVPGPGGQLVSVWTQDPAEAATFISHDQAENFARPRVEPGEAYRIAEL